MIVSFLVFLATVPFANARIPRYAIEDGDLEIINSELGLGNGNQIGGREVYKIQKQMLSWHEQDQLAKKAGCNLASIHNEKDMKDILELTSKDKDYWIGGQRDGSLSSTWTWSDGSPWDYTGWYDGEPNNMHGVEDCVEVYHPRNVKKQWVDNPCLQKNMAIYTCPPRIYLESEKLSWKDHNLRAISKGYVLASIHSKADVMTVKGVLKMLPLNEPVWIGGKRKTPKSNTWLWSDGSPWNFSNWSPGEPNNGRGNYFQGCTQIWRDQKQWDDQQCAIKQPAVYMLKVSAPRIYLESEKLSWKDHNLRAISKGYVLASIHSKADVMAVKGVLKMLPLNAPVWIGGKRKTPKSNTWLWSDGSPWNFSNWSSGEPNNGNGNYFQGCTQIWRDQKQWDDNQCAIKQPAVYMLKVSDVAKIW